MAHRGIIVGACLLWAVLAVPAAASVQDTAPDLEPPVTNRSVETIVRDGSTLYLGGDFTYVGRRTSLARLGADGRSTGTFPRVTDGSVEALLDDGAGGWFAAGSFATIGGADVPRLAHVLADGTVDAAFRPAPDGEVRALALAGGTLFAGGTFDSVAGGDRANLALLDPADGSLLAAAPDPDGAVFELTAAGGDVLVGGAFTTLGGQARGHVAALDATTRVLTAWSPDADATVRAIAADGSDVYLGGDFANVGGSARSRLAAVDVATGAVGAWSPTADGTVHDLAVDATDVYAAGEFGSLSGSVDYGFGKLDRATGATLHVNANLVGHAHSLMLDGGRLYVGGRPWEDWPQPVDVHEAIAAIDLVTGDLAWTAPYAGGAVHALAVRGGDVYAGGTFDSAGGEQRAHLAAIDLDTGEPTAWHPDPDGPVRALALHDGMLFAGGAFTHAAGAGRERIAAFDTGSGALTAFDGRADGIVEELVAGDDGVFAAGAFANAGGQPRTRLAALDPVTGDARVGWDPAPNNTVTALALQDGTLYAGGTFTSIGGAARTRLAAVDAAAGAATAFEPAPADGQWDPALITALTPTGDGTVFVTGKFQSAGGELRINAAELDGVSGDATPWFGGYSVPSGLTAVAVSPTRVYLGGRTSAWGSAEPLVILEERDRASGGLIGWIPRTEGGIRDLELTGGALIAAGAFTAVNTAPHRNLASWSPPPAPLASPHVTGTVAEDETLTCAPGAWEGAPTGFGYTWLRDGAEIPGANDHEYVITGDDTGATLRCRVVARTRGGSATALSAPAGSPDPPAVTDPPEITGTVEYEQEVTCDPGTWSVPATFTFQWLRDGAAIAGAGDAAYTLADADAGSELSCRVVAENAGGTVSADSAAAAVADAPALLTPPQVNGTARPGAELTCGPGAWSGSPTAYTWRWLDQGGAEVGTEPAFTVRDTDAETSLACEVTARNAGGVTSTSVYTWIAVPPTNAVLPSIAGTPYSGQALTCVQGAWSGGSWLVGIRWLRDGAPVGVDLTWTPGAADIGHTVRCEVTTSNGLEAIAVSAPVTITAAPPPAPAPAPTTPTAPTPTQTPAPPAAATVRIARSVAARGGRVTVARLACPAGRRACAGTATIVTVRGNKRLGRATVSVPAGRSAAVRVKVARVRRATRVVVTVVIDGRTTRQQLTLKPR